MKRTSSGVRTKERPGWEGNAEREGTHARVAGPEDLVLVEEDLIEDARFGGVDAVFLDDGAPRQVTNGNDVVGPVHAVFLDSENRGIDIAAATVEIGGMHMNDQRFTGNLLGMYAGRIGQPVVRVNDIARIGASNHTGHNRIVVDFFEQVVGITTRELDATQIIGVQVIEVGINMVSQIEIFLRVHAVAKPPGDIVPRDIAPCDGCVSGTDDVGKTFVFITVWFGYDKSDIHIAALGHTFCKAIARRA